ncbi:protein ecdysoneless [Rhypophila decipiens]|uniref:Protein ecdysoneless n=1 Tax=Rhypophila decipiens TaxID=261697 RepID=A0AAN6YHS0_9PEZI|nr:protein ecdysoneless [Rhypophila decipiens]
MDSQGEKRPGDEGFGGFRMTLPENCVEYMLFVVEEGGQESRRLQNLEAVRKAAMQKAEELTKDYIWQREGFGLETKVENGQAYLHGITDYGDNVEDEWLIVYLLRELSKSFPSLWIRVFDSDGEFLLIEAAKVLPKWLSPEMDSNRVWLHDGKLLIIPLPSETDMSKSISLAKALRILKSAPDSLVHSTFIEAEAFYRLEKYPDQIKDSLHYSVVTIPRKLAYILHARPKAIAPATEAFYLRDPIALKPLLSSSPTKLIFPPPDLVTVSICFTKVLYAQLKSQQFSPPPVAWKPLLQAAGATSLAGNEAAEPMSQDLARLDMGMKITSGFEMLCKDAHKSKNRTTREVALLLADLEEDGEADALPTDEEIKLWKDVLRQDDDSWMNIDFADFEAELNGSKSRSNEPGFGDATAQADLQKIVSRFEAFLNDEQAGIDGAQLDEMDEDDDDDDDTEEYSSEDDEDREVSFDEEQFARMMREMMGLPSSSTAKQPTATLTMQQDKAVAKVEEELGQEDEEEEIQNLMSQFEKELKEAGALSLDPPSKESDKKLLTKDGKGKEKEKELLHEELDEEEEDDDLVDIDYNLAKNLLESFKSQAGMAGPAGNLLSLMGMKLPRDEDDGEEEDK